MQKIVKQQELLNGNWKIVTTWTKDDQEFRTWIGEDGQERMMVIRHYEERVYHVIYLPTQKIIQTFHCTLNRHAVGEEEYGPDEVYFSTDGKFVVTEENYGTKVERYNLEDLINLSKNQ